MPEIILSQVGPITDARVKSFADDIVDTLRLAAEKATANLIDPATYPLSQRANSFEQIFRGRLTEFEKNPRLKPQLAAARANGATRLALSAKARQKDYGRLARVNLKDPTAVEAQVSKLPVPANLKLGPAYLNAAGFFPVNAVPPILFTSPRFGVPTVARQAKTLEFRLLQVHCADETGGWFVEKFGKDDISLGGTMIDATGTTTKINQFKVMNFDDGDTKDYAPPKVLANFNLRKGTVWPKSYFVVLSLVEVDMGGYADYLNKLADAIDKYVKEKLGNQIPGGPLGQAIGWAVGYVVDKIMDWLKQAWSDDIFDPVTLTVEIPSASSLFAGAEDSPNLTQRITGHNGDYRLTYDWKLTDFSAISRAAPTVAAAGTA